MSKSLALCTILETLEAILNMLKEVKQQERPTDFKARNIVGYRHLKLYSQSTCFILI